MNVCHHSLCLFVGVLFFSYLANLIRVDPLSKVDQFIMAYGGLRGAIAFSLVVLLKEDLFPNKKLFMTTTIVVIYFTVFVQVCRVLSTQLM